MKGLRKGERSLLRGRPRAVRRKAADMNLAAEFEFREECGVTERKKTDTAID
jgi:hypothetical protein